VIGWRDLHLWQIQPVRDVLLGLAIVGLFLLGDATSVVTVPLLLAILFAYLFEPVIAWLEAKSRFTRPAVVGGLIGRWCSSWSCPR
jgi:predicted PurR-regulated permease PerM